MAQRYQGTFGFLKTPSGKKILVDITNVDAQYTEVVDTKGNNYTLASDTGCELEFTQVPSQWFQPDPEHIAYVTRRPERQYKRGICNANTAIWIPGRSGDRLSDVPTTSIRIEAIFNPSEIRAFDDYHKIKCGLWSKFFAWAESTVYAKDLKIGTVDHETKAVSLQDEMFLQEVRDALVRSNSDYSVKVGNV